MIPVAPSTVALAETLAKAHGTWDGSREVVDLVKTIPGVRPDVDTQYFLESVAWLHNVFKGSVTQADLIAAGIPEHVAFAVKELAGEPWYTMHSHYRRLFKSFELVRMVKVCTHVVKLRNRDKPGHFRSETDNFVRQLTYEMGEPWKGWLNEQLTEATSRP